MTQYKPFWTEQTTTTTTTTNPSKLLKTIDDYTVLILATLVMFITIFIAIVAENYYKGQKEIEFVKAGLIQKVEDGKVIWTKP